MFLFQMPLREALLDSALGMGVVVVTLGFLAVLVQLLTRVVGFVERRAHAALPPDVLAISELPPQPEPLAPPKGEPLPAHESQGHLVLVDVDEPTAAMVMAIVSHQSGVPLHRLLFKRIRLLEEET